MSYKDTLNLPKTNFSMKANLPQREPEMLKRWKDMDMYARLREKGAGKPKYILHDGPPYANGSIHMGHVLNKLLKDMVVKSRSMMGYDAPYVPGWDCHGLPVEHQLFKEMGKDKSAVDQVKFRKQARDYAMKYVGIQREEFKRIGVFGDWENPYLTLNEAYEAGIIYAFADLVEKGYVYKGLKPVNWCATCETALAEAEVEYAPHSSPSVFVKFKARELKGAKKNDGETFFVIWTTTPWTLLANVAIAIHPDLNYIGLSGNSGETFIVAEELKAAFLEKVGDAAKDLRQEWILPGKDLEGSVCDHPFIERESRVVLADYVSHEDGTGCVHTAPGHGQDDFITGRKYGLPVIMPVNDNGTFNDTAGEFAGLHVYKANPKIIEKLEAVNALVHSEKTEHSYPHCWRCKRPIIFRATEQYFMSVDHNGLRAELGKIIDKDVKWIPEAGRERISAMVGNRPDWCLSRQRYWGVPIIAFYCKGCGEFVLDAGVIRHVASIFEKEGSDVWFAKEPGELMPGGYVCRACGKNDFRGETDILDVWFESGVSHYTVLNPRKQFPADLYLEGSDQHRGWFQSSLITSVGMNKVPPFKAVLTHGFVVDGEGKKMSKSLGNVIAPKDFMSKYGADIMRMWVASCDYTDDIRMSEQIIARMSEAYRKIRNTFRFILANLNDFDPDRDSVSAEKWSDIDLWAVDRARQLLATVNRNYTDHVFHKVFSAIYNFCVVDMSSIFMDVQKDTFYTEAKDSELRRSAQCALYEILKVLVHVTAPILAFTADEVWSHMPGDKSGAESVHLSDWPDEASLAGKTGKYFGDDKRRIWDERLLPLRGAVLKSLEVKRAEGAIGSALEAKVEIFSDSPEWQAVLKENRSQLGRLFIVSGADVADADPQSGVKADDVPVKVSVMKADGAKCNRCWNYSMTVGSDGDHSDLCERCVRIVKKGA